MIGLFADFFQLNPTRKTLMSYHEVFRLLAVVLLATVMLFALSRQNFCVEQFFQTPESESYLKRIFTTDNGLPQNSTNAVIQTRDGYIWIATFAGLARYDGVKFTIFTVSNTPGLTDNRITSLYEDPHGVLWIGSENNILLNYKDGKFTRIGKDTPEPAFRSIAKISMDANNILWFWNGTLNTYNPATGEFSEFSRETVIPNPKGGEGFWVYAFAEDDENNFWMASSRGLIAVRDGKFVNYTTVEGLPDNDIRFLKATPAGLIIVTASGAVGRYSDGKFTPFEEKHAQRFLPYSNTNLSDYFFFGLGLKLYRVYGNELISFQLPNQDVRTEPMLDNEGNLWLGGNYDLTQYKPRYVTAFSTIEENTAYGERNYWHGVSRILQDGEGTVWYTSNYKLYRFAGGKIENAAPSNPSFAAVGTAGIDNDGVLWVAAGSEVYRYEDGTFVKKIDFGESLKEFQAFFFDRDGNFWLGSDTNGLYHYSGGVFTHYTTKDGLANNTVAYITQDRAGAIWIGTRNGLSRLSDGKFINYTTDNGLSNNYVREIYEDQDGTFWIGTYGGGILRYRDGKFVAIRAKDGLPEDIASRILVDDSDRFWVLGNQGIYSVPRAMLNDFADRKVATVYCVNYNKDDGMVISEGRGGGQPAGWKMRDGRLYFPTIRGGVSIDPTRPKSIAPPVYVENVLVNGTAVDRGRDITVDPGYDSFEIQFTAVHFTQPDQVKFQFLLDGYDSDWRDSGTVRTVTYTYLSPGRYTFHVRAVTADGVWSENDARIDINVRSGFIFHRRADGSTAFAINFPFYLYWWLYLLLAIIAGCLLALYLRRRSREFKRRELEQQEFSRQLINAHETERRRLAGELHDGVGQSLAMIKNMADLGVNETSDRETSEQFDRILKESVNSISEIRDITNNLRPHLLDKLGLTDAIRLFIEKIAEAGTIDVFSDIDDIDNLFSPEDEINIYRIIQESFNNILKHSDASEAQITVKNYSSQISVVIKDDGRGFEPDLTGAGDRSGGLGLMGIAERVRMLDGKLFVQSKIGRGTTISITIQKG